MKRDFIFINEGKAILPMNQAIKEHYSGQFNFIDMSFDAAKAYPRLQDAVAWITMGFYREKLNAGVVIHDYRSLSVGRLATLKDKAKRFLTPKPDFRITKPEIQKVMRFADDADTYYIDIAAKDAILNFRKERWAKRFDYCYIGVINRERGIDKVIHQFLATPGVSTLLLVGRVEDGIDQEFTQDSRVTFTGKVPQSEVFDYVNASHVTLAYFPNIYPHNKQTPTKLLEYACLGARILANEQPMNVSIGSKYSISMIIRPDSNIFDDLPELSEWPTNWNTDPKPMLFSSHLRESGLDRLFLSLMERE